MMSWMKGPMRKELVVVWVGVKFECQGLKIQLYVDIVRRL